MNRRTFASALTGAAALTSADNTYRVRIKGQVQRMALEPFTIAVLTGEASVLHSVDAIKAMAVTARTYAVHFRGRHAAEGFDLCDTTHCQRLDLSTPSARILAAVNATEGEILLHQGQPARAYYSLDCGGRTEDARQAWPPEGKEEKDVAPYLNSHPDPYCQRNPARWHWEVSPADLRAALTKAALKVPTAAAIAIVEHTPASGRARTLLLTGGGENVRVAASSLRFAVGRTFGFQALPSDLYEVGMSNGRIVFNGTGAGHGVGLCQRGADQMGAMGHGYREILAFYFPGTAINGQTKPTWTRISGERISLFTTQSTLDGEVLPIAERLLLWAETRTHLKAPRGIQLRLHPSVAEFIHATGEPGWVAARTSELEIQLQPARVLRDRGALESTLRHELIHVLIDANSKPGLPIWFREGLAEFLSGGAHSRPGAHLTERDLRQTADQARARTAYEAARNRVDQLMKRHGETAVLAWLARGLPAEVMQAANKPPATNSR